MHQTIWLEIECRPDRHGSVRQHLHRLERRLYGDGYLQSDDDAVQKRTSQFLGELGCHLQPECCGSRHREWNGKESDRHHSSN